jgi:hypothetical protein
MRRAVQFWFAVKVAIVTIVVHIAIASAALSARSAVVTESAVAKIFAFVSVVICVAHAVS